MRIHWRKPDPENLAEECRRMSDQNVTHRNVGMTRNWSLDMFRELPDTRVVEGDLWQFRRTRLGEGQAVYEAAREGLRLGKPFDLGWVRCIQHRPLQPNDTFCLQATAFGLFCVNFCRVICLEEEQDHDCLVASLILGTLPIHAAVGEERMSIAWNRNSNTVDFLLGSFSRPAGWFVHLMAPYLRNQQNRFAVGSAQSLMQFVKESKGKNRERASVATR